MPVLLVKVVFIAISNVSYFVSRFIFSGIACLLVMLIKAFKVPGENAKGLMEHVAEAIKGVLEFVVGAAVDAISAAISTSFDLVKDGAAGSAVLLGSTLAGLLEQTRGSLEGVFKDLPELGEGFKDMVTTIAYDLMSNYKEALAYFTENV